MKNYLFENYGTISQFKKSCLKDLKTLIGQEAVCIYGQGTIADVIDESPLNKSITISIEVNNEIKKFNLFTAVDAGSIGLSTNSAELVKYISTTYDDFQKQFIQQARKEQLEYELYIKELEEKQAIRDAERKKAEAELKKQARFETYKNNLIKKANDLSDVKLDKFNDYYLSLGYIAKHLKNITAAMPDFLDSWFIDQFGNQEHTVIDSNKRTTGGYPMQWSLSMQINLDTNENIPAYLLKYMGSTKKAIQPISNTEFVFSLMQDSGLTFGKNQDLDKIIENIPVECLESFNYGYSL